MFLVTDLSKGEVRQHCHDQVRAHLHDLCACCVVAALFASSTMFCPYRYAVATPQMLRSIHIYCGMMSENGRFVYKQKNNFSPPPPSPMFVQKECRRSGYRSNPVRLPPEAAPSKDDLEAFELELGLAAAMRESPADWAAVA